MNASSIIVDGLVKDDDDTDVFAMFCFDTLLSLVFLVPFLSMLLMLLPPSLFSSTFNNDDDDDDDDHIIKSCISRPTPSGKKRHHATHATELSNIVFVIVNAIPICIEHISIIVQYNALLVALQKLQPNAIGTPNNST
jgi:hypothetical protein